MRRLKVEEVLDDVVAVVGHEGFGVELDAVQRMLRVADGHDFLVGGPGFEGEIFGDAVENQ